MIVNGQLDRSERFFGVDGQEAIRRSTVVFAGVGGLGSFSVQQGALLHIGRMILADPGRFKVSNRNRYATSCFGEDVGEWKADLGMRLVKSINPEIELDVVYDSIISENGISAMKEANLVVGCLDNEGSRLLLLQACARLGVPYIDFATEILPGNDVLRYGGRVVSSFFGNGCVACLGVLDQEEAGKELASAEELENRRSVYGVDTEFLADSGPSVGPLNGVVASVGMSEVMAYLAGLRVPVTHLNYTGHTGKVSVRQDIRPSGGCYFCDVVFPGNEVVGFDDLIECDEHRTT